MPTSQRICLMLCAVACSYSLDALEHQPVSPAPIGLQEPSRLAAGGLRRATWTGINCISRSVPLDTSVKYCEINDLTTFPVNFASPNRQNGADCTALQPVFSARCTLFPVVRSFPPAKIRSSCPRLRANFSQQFGCWMVNCSSEGSGVNILAGARVRQAACFAVPGCLGYCCAFYRY